MQSIKHKNVLKKRKKEISSNEEKSNVMNFLRGQIYGYFFTAACLLILALLLTYTNIKINDNQSLVIVIIITILAVVLAGYKTSKAYLERKWMWGALAGLLYFVILMILSLILRKQLTFSNNIATTILMCIGSGALGGLLSKKNK